MHIQSFSFNPFQENTYIIYDETKECIIIDPGCYEGYEKKMLEDFIKKNNLNPVRLVNTHCHIDHVCGNKFVSEKYNLKLEAHELEIQNLESAVRVGEVYGVPVEASPSISKFLNEEDVIKWGNSELQIFFTPGHSAGSISFYNAENNLLISGDVLFYQSIGRYDLPGGNLNILLQSIKEKLFTLPNDTQVYSGHGQMTTIGYEKKHNPFLID